MVLMTDRNVPSVRVLACEKRVKRGDLQLRSGRTGERATGTRVTRPGQAFADAHADQNERDYAALVGAIRDGRITSEPQP